MPPNFSEGDGVLVHRQRTNFGDKTCPYWDGPSEVVAKKAHDLYVIQVDQRRLVDVHIDCRMKTVHSPRSPVPLNYTEEIARVPSQFEEDTYILKKKMGHRTHRRRLPFKVRREGYTRDWDTEEPVETFLPSYNKVWRDYLQKQNLTQTINLLTHLGGPLSLACHGKKALTNMRIYCCLGKEGESEKRWETGRTCEDNVQPCRAPRSQKSP